MRQPEHARALLSRVDPARLRWGLPVGLRDGAVLALLAAGLTAAELAALHATAVTVERGRLQVQVQRQGVPWAVTLPPELGGRLLAWLTERRVWATPEPVFIGVQGPLTPMAVHQILHRYRQERRQGRKTRR